MSEYWVSHKKYFCRYCEIYIADDAPSRQLHENGLRHKGNRDRFIRGLYKAGEKKKKDIEEEKREMARVELVSPRSHLSVLPFIINLYTTQAAQAAFTQDVGAGIAKATPRAPIASTPAGPRKPPQKPSNPYTNYSTPASLGYSDPDVDRLQIEADTRRSQGIAGGWEVVVPPPTPSHPISDDVAPSASFTSPVGIDGTLKREADPALDAEDSRHFKLRKKTMSAGLGEIYDPGMIILKKKDPPVKREDLPEPTAQSDPAPRPKWTKVQWKRADNEVQKENGAVLEDADEQAVDVLTVPKVKPEVDIELELQLPLDQQTRVDDPVKREDHPSDPAPESGGSLFRKRKTPAGRAK